MNHPAIPPSVQERLPKAVPLHQWAPEAAERTAATDTAGNDATGDSSGAGDMSRRVALKVLATAAAVPAAACVSEDEPGSEGSAQPEDVLDVTQPPSNPLAAGTPTDPDLLNAEVPWPLELSAHEMTTVQALADLVIPADDRSPSASAVGAHHYVNEYVSAPYPSHQDDLVLIRGGLAWLNQEAMARFEVPFSEGSVEQQTEICDEIHHLPDAPPERRAQARFFDLFRDLVSTAFWTTDEGMADLGYAGNVASLEFPGPPAEVLRHLGLE